MNILTLNGQVLKMKKNLTTCSQLYTYLGNLFKNASVCVCIRERLIIKG